MYVYELRYLISYRVESLPLHLNHLKRHFCLISYRVERVESSPQSEGVRKLNLL